MEYQRKVSWVFFFSGILDFEILMVQTILEKKKNTEKKGPVRFSLRMMIHEASASIRKHISSFFLSNLTSISPSFPSVDALFYPFKALKIELNKFLHLQ